MGDERTSYNSHGERSLWPGYDELLTSIRRNGFATLFKPTHNPPGCLERSLTPTQEERKFDSILWRRMTRSINNCIGSFVIEDNLFKNLTRSVDMVSIKQFLGRRFTRRLPESVRSADSRVEVRLVLFPSGVSQCIFFHSKIKHPV